MRSAISRAKRLHPRAFPVLAALLLLSGPVAVHAADANIFTMPAEDGYGIEDCMKAGSACGRVVADSWCGAHGHADAIAFGTADDVTGATPASASTPPATSGYVIRCGD